MKTLRNIALSLFAAFLLIGSTAPAFASDWIYPIESHIQSDWIYPIE